MLGEWSETNLIKCEKEIFELKSIPNKPSESLAEIQKLADMFRSDVERCYPS